MGDTERMQEPNAIVDLGDDREARVGGGCLDAIREGCRSFGTAMISVG